MTCQSIGGPRPQDKVKLKDLHLRLFPLIKHITTNILEESKTLESLFRQTSGEINNNLIKYLKETGSAEHMF